MDVYTSILRPVNVLRIFCASRLGLMQRLLYWSVREVIHQRLHLLSRRLKKAVPTLPWMVGKSRLRHHRLWFLLISTVSVFDMSIKLKFLGLERYVFRNWHFIPNNWNWFSNSSPSRFCSIDANANSLSSKEGIKLSNLQIVDGLGNGNFLVPLSFGMGFYRPYFQQQTFQKEFGFIPHAPFIGMWRLFHDGLHHHFILQ